MRESQTFTLHIDTPQGRQCVPAAHIHDEWETQQGTLLVPMMATSVCIELNGQVLEGCADDTEYALKRLAEQLPEGCRLRCCLSCRHGHFCPVGDADNKLFCVTDFEPQQKSDLYHVTEDEQERARRSRSLFHVCEAFKPVSEEYYIYK